MSQDIGSQPSGGTGSTKDTARDQAGAVGERAKGEAGDVAAHAKQEAGQVVQQAKQEAAHVAGEAREQARNLYEDARGQVREQASSQTDRMAGGVQQLAAGLQALARGDTDAAGPLGGYAEQFGTRLDEFGRRMQDLGYEGILEEAKRYARRRPGTFLLGAAAAGLVVGRAVRGERDRQQASQPMGAGQQQLAQGHRGDGGMLSTAAARGVIAPETAPPAADVERSHDELIVTDPTLTAPVGGTPPAAGEGTIDLERDHDAGIAPPVREER